MFRMAPARTSSMRRSLTLWYLVIWAPDNVMMGRRYEDMSYDGPIPLICGAVVVAAACCCLLPAACCCLLPAACCGGGVR